MSKPEKSQIRKVIHKKHNTPNKDYTTKQRSSTQALHATAHKKQDYTTKQNTPDNRGTTYIKTENNTHTTPTNNTEHNKTHRYTKNTTCPTKTTQQNNAPQPKHYTQQHTRNRTTQQNKTHQTTQAQHTAKQKTTHTDTTTQNAGHSQGLQTTTDLPNTSKIINKELMAGLRTTPTEGGILTPPHTHPKHGKQQSKQAFRPACKQQHNLVVGCFGLNSPLRQYFSLYWTVTQREEERREKR